MLELRGDLCGLSSGDMEMVSRSKGDALMDQRISASRRSFLTFGEVAEWPGCTERMMWNVRTTGQIASVKVGRLVRFEPRDVDEDLSRHRLEVTA
jgi:hypothetical protein